VYALWSYRSDANGNKTVDEESKEAERKRYRRSLQHHVGYEEQKRRKLDANRRRSERTSSRPLRRDWDEADEDLADFEKIRRTSREAINRGSGPSASELAELPRAVVAAVHYGRIELDSGATARIAGHLFVDPEFRLAVGDEVAIEEAGDRVRIEARLDRRTCLSRPDPDNPNRALVIAANVDVAVIVVAVKAPALRPGLIDRLLLALAHGGVAPAICVNKLDLLETDECEQLETILAPYVPLGCDVFRCSASTGAGIAALRAQLAGKTCVFIGHSGVGKSSILNVIDPGGTRVTGATREHDGKGRHTTAWSSLRELEDGTRVIDTPGVRSFGLDRLEPSEVRAGFAEFGPLTGGCRYADCTHVHEPQCAVREAVSRDALSAERYASYLRILYSI
jgi:ribosome biogenesis GTPase